MRLTAGLAVGLAAVASLAAAPAQARTPAALTDPWGPLYLLDLHPVSYGNTVATTDRGMNVVTWRERRSDGTYQATASVQVPGRTWSAPLLVNGTRENAVAVQPVAWGDGNVSVLWETRTAVDEWTFKMRTVDAAGSWGPTVRLRAAPYSFPGYQVDINDAGAIALSWENGDHQDRVAVRRADGTWQTFIPVPVVSPGTNFRYIANPLDVFITRVGQVSVATWGRRVGTAGHYLWLEDLASDGTWKSTRLGPTNGATLGYDWVPESQFAGNSDGDFAAVWSQQDPQTHRWTTFFAYRPSGADIRQPQVLGHYRCDYFYISCGDTALADSGHAIVTWPRTAQDIDIQVARTSLSGRIGATQSVFTVEWSNAYSGVQVAENAAGDATVNLVGGNRQSFDQVFVRCPVGQPCSSPVTKQNSPSWLDPLNTAVSPSGATTMTWVSGCSGGEACRPNHVWARRLVGAR